MLSRFFSRKLAIATATWIMIVIVVPYAGAQITPKAKKRKGTAGTSETPPAKTKVDERRVSPADPRSRLIVTDAPDSRVRTTYLKTRPEYRHVRVAKFPRRRDGGLDSRFVIVRSARVTPRSWARFDDRRQTHIDAIIRDLRAGQRGQALRVWGELLDGLRDYREPVDLDEIMLYITRESCLHQDGAVLYYARKLEYLADAEERLEDYIDQLFNLREDCRHGARRCAPEAISRIEDELIKARAELQIMRIEARDARADFDAGMDSGRDHEVDFAAVLDSLYHEVEVRVCISP